MQLINTLMFALEADTVEYGEWKTGQRTEGATYAIFSFTRKITQSIGGALGAFALALGGYITKLAAGQVQPDSAITAIKASIGLVPAAAAILAMLAFIAYPLTEKKLPRHRRRERQPQAEIPGKAKHRHRADPLGHRLTVPEARTANHSSKGMTMVDLSAKPFNLDEEAIGWVHDTIDVDDAARRRSASSSSTTTTRSRPSTSTTSSTTTTSAACATGPGRRGDPGAHPLRAVEIEGAAADRVEPGDGRLRQQQRRHLRLHPPAGRLAPGHVDRPRHGRRGRRGMPRHRLQLGVRADRRHPLQLAQHGRSPPARSATPRRWSSSARRSTSTGSASQNMVCAMKHFPGDGIDERDQHVVTSWNTLGADEWDARPTAGCTAR